MADNAMLLEAGPRGPRLGGKRRDGAGNWRERLAALFPEAAVSEARVSTATVSEAKGTPSRRPRRRAVGVAVQVAVVCAAAAVLLLRVAGIPAWDGTYAEDNGVFLVDALVRPWHLLVPYSGYLELGPRVIGQIVASFLPIVDASVAYAITGALIGGAAGLFLYHASEGYIRAPWARALLGGALVLLPIAPLDIIDSGVDSPWYAMAALFFAVLWRPRSWPGMLAAALVACYASSSEIVAVIYAPLLLIRLIALPRVREHAVTAGWLLGLMLQVPVVVLSYTQHKQRLGALATPGQAVAFYCHNVLLRALGWHLSIWLKSAAGYNGATAIVGALVALAIGWTVVTGDRPVRLFAVIALLTGFVQTIFDATISQYVIFQQPTPTFMAAARYSTIPVLLIAATGIAAVDSYIRRHRAARETSAALGRPVPPGKSVPLRGTDAARETSATRGMGAAGRPAPSGYRCLPGDQYRAAYRCRPGYRRSPGHPGHRGHPLPRCPAACRGLPPCLRARLRLGHRLQVRLPADQRRPLAALRAEPRDGVHQGPGWRRHTQRLGRPPFHCPLRPHPPLRPSGLPAPCGA